MNTYTKGQNVRFSATLTDVNGTAVDPTTITFKILPPGGTAVVYVYGTNAEVVKDGTGLYHCDYTLSTKGDWTYRWESTGTYVAAEEDRVRVSKSAF